jgi:hypothetical protein
MSLSSTEGERGRERKSSGDIEIFTFSMSSERITKISEFADEYILIK